MTEFDDWFAANDKFLTGAVAWLRERLEAARTPEARADTTATTQEPKAFFSRRTARPPAMPAAAIGRPAPAAVPMPLDAAEDQDDPPPLIMLARRLGMTAFERNVLLLSVAMELDTRIAGLCARVHRVPAMDYPTFALAMSVFDDPGWDAISPERPLRHWQLVDVVRTGPEPLTSSRLRADDRIVSFVKGLHHLDERLRPILRPLPKTSSDDLAPSQQSVAEEVTTGLRRVSADGAPAPTVLLLGPDRACKRLVAGEVARIANLHLFTLDAEDLPSERSDLESLSRLWHRETLLAPVGLHIDAHDVDRRGAAADSVRRWLRERPGLVLLDVREMWPDVTETAVVPVDVARPMPAEQLSTWQDALRASVDDVAPSRLAGQFDLDLTNIRRIAHETADVVGEQRLTALWRACLLHSRPVLDELAQRLDPKATMDDLQLPDPEKRQLEQILDQVSNRGKVYDGMGFRERMNRGLGISVLFAGESGTGKTMAAEALAHKLDLLLYRIDLSSVVDKYIGETEKNLRRLFDAAEGGGAILFFDEADALFGKRSEVKDSHDRYANIEINYLLQRLEGYRGLAILATNRKSSMDTAFLRRLRFIVSFPFPGVTQRTEIWSHIFPEQAEAGELDVARLARLDLTGGSIQTVALNAAFAAAAMGSRITMPLMLDAARAELRKLEKPVNESDFRWLELAEGSA
ncbi:AAA family ATPase [Arthrobacter sp. AK04]|uniref:ATP-binding protein n=1 Tax=Arthrobacter sp. AK04 TaxID=2900048 RepID=UPI001E33798E|nr:AAA family ATPase [Arthrobacter sp. AK04]MCD5341557.1 AAA family ATPase [Arthrobacter sp. AK04]